MGVHALCCVTTVAVFLLRSSSDAASLLNSGGSETASIAHPCCTNVRINLTAQAMLVTYLYNMRGDSLAIHSGQSCMDQAGHETTEPFRGADDPVQRPPAAAAETTSTIAGHHEMLDVYVGAESVSFVGSPQRSGRRQNTSHEPATNSSSASPHPSSVFSFQGLLLQHQYRRMMFRLSAAADAPLAATLFVPLEGRSSAASPSGTSVPSPPSAATATGEQAAPNASQVSFWVVAKLHLGSPGNRHVQPLRYAWMCSLPLDTDQNVTSEHWLALDMKAFFARTFTGKDTSLGPPSLLISGPPRQPPVDRLHVTVQAARPHFNSSSVADGGSIATELLDVSAGARHLCGQILTLPCSRGQRGVIQWAPFLAFANDEPPRLGERLAPTLGWIGGLDTEPSQLPVLINIMDP